MDPVQLDAFTILERLGAGGHADVWRARHGSGAEVALKFLKRPLRGAVRSAHFHGELRVVARLDHPNVVPVLGFGRVGAELAAAVGCVPDTGWIALGLARGGSLADHLGCMSVGQARMVLLQVLEGLAHAHAHGVLHLDVKPQNVLMDGSVARLADFGIARFLDDPAASELAGSPAYMAPEQFVRGARLGPWTDIYAFGCLAWTVMTGAPPYSGRTPAELALAHATDPVPEPPRHLPEALRGWLLRLMAKAPSQRLQHAVEARDGLVSPWSWPAAAGGAQESTTVDFDAPPPVRLPPSAPAPRLAPVPASWRTVADEVPAAQLRASRRRLLPGYGLGLLTIGGTALVGRLRERDLLWEALRRVVAERLPRVVIIRGEQGLGASRLMDWLQVRAVERGVALRIEASALESALGGALPEDAWPGVACLEHPDHDALRALQRLLLHADAPPWLVGVTTRPEGRGPAGVEDVLDALMRSPQAERLDLGALPVGHVEDLLASVEAFDGALADRLVSGCAGNPGELLGTIDALSSAGRLVPSPTGLRCDDAPLPTMRHHATTRLARWLGTHPDDAVPLQLAAVLHPRSPQVAWAQAARQLGAPSTERVPEWLEAGLAHGHDGGWRLDTQLVPVLRARCREEGGWVRLHEALLAVGAWDTLEGRAGAAAEAERWDDAATWSLDAARHDRVFDTSRVYAVLRQAAHALTRGSAAPEDPRWALLYGLGALKGCWAGREAVPGAQQALERWVAEHDDPRGAAWLHLVRAGGMRRRQDAREGAEHALRAARLAEDIGDPLLCGRALSLAVDLMALGGHEEAPRLIARALDHQARHELLELEGNVALQAMAYHGVRGDHELATRFGERAARAFAESGSHRNLVIIEVNLGIAALDRGDFGRARQLLGEAHRKLERMGEKLALIARLHLLRLDVEASVPGTRPALEALVRLLEEIGAGPYVATARILLVRVLAEAGDVQSVGRVLDALDAARAADDVKPDMFLVQYLQVAASALEALGERDVAARAAALAGHLREALTSSPSMSDAS